MKKFFVSVLLLTSIFFAFSVNAYAVNSNGTTTYCYDDLGIEVIFNANTALNEEQQKRVADILAYDLSPVESRAWCWLVGHTYVSSAVTVITHEARELNPRCLQQTYEVTTCENCSYYNEELLGSHYIVCCPEE